MKSNHYPDLTENKHNPVTEDHCDEQKKSSDGCISETTGISQAQHRFKSQRNNKREKIDGVVIGNELPAMLQAR